MGSERLPGSALGLLVGPQMGALATLSRAGKTGTGAGARREGQWIQGTLSSHQDSAAVADARSGSLQEPRKGEAAAASVCFGAGSEEGSQGSGAPSASPARLWGVLALLCPTPGCLLLPGIGHRLCSSETPTLA